jgi:hypothetical protein
VIQDITSIPNNLKPSVKAAKFMLAMAHSINSHITKSKHNLVRNRLDGRNNYREDKSFVMLQPVQNTLMQIKGASHGIS